MKKENLKKILSRHKIDSTLNSILETNEKKIKITGDTWMLFERIK